MLNLTQHVGSPAQVAQGLVDLEGCQLATLKKLLTFTAEDILSGKILVRAAQIAQLASVSLRDSDDNQCLIGGLPALMGPLTTALEAMGLEAFFAHSDRVSVEDPLTGVKTSQFVHQFFYAAV